MKKMSQMVPETGVTADYFNEFYGFYFDYNDGTFDLAQVVRRVRQYPPQLYVERYAEYEGPLITDQNREAIRELDEIVETIRGWNNPEAITSELVYDTLARANKLIYGVE